MENEWWSYNKLKPMPEGGYLWHPAGKGNYVDDNIDFHIDLGAGRLPKGRLKIDRHGDADILMDLNRLYLYKFGDETRPKYSDEDLSTIAEEDSVWNKSGSLPFPDNSIESMISHHCLEHIGDGFLRLMDECYRVLKPAGKFRIIVPLFPSLAAVSDPDHVRYFCESTFESFCHVGGPQNPFWSDSFAEPYTKARFILKDKDITPPQKFRADEIIDVDKLFKEPREIRVTLQKPTR